MIEAWQIVSTRVLFSHKEKVAFEVLRKVGVGVGVGVEVECKVKMYVPLLIILPVHLCSSCVHPLMFSLPTSY